MDGLDHLRNDILKLIQGHLSEEDHKKCMGYVDDLVQRVRSVQAIGESYALQLKENKEKIAELEESLKKSLK